MKFEGQRCFTQEDSTSIAPAPSAPSSDKLLMPRSIKDVDNEEASGSKETQCDQLHRLRTVPSTSETSEAVISR